MSEEKTPGAAPMNFGRVLRIIVFSVIWSLIFMLGVTACLGLFEGISQVEYFDDKFEVIDNGFGGFGFFIGYFRQTPRYEIQKLILPLSEQKGFSVNKQK